MRPTLFFFAPPDDAQNSYSGGASQTPNNASTQAGAGSSRTPFDQSLLHDPDAPRDTQPLSPINAANTTSPTGASRTLPPQVVPGARPPQSAPANLNVNNDDTVQPSVTNKPTRKLPTSTLVGMSMAGGAVAVLIISMLVRSIIPTPKSPEQQTTIAQSPPTVDIERKPEVIMTPDDETQPTTQRPRAQSPADTSGESSSPDVTITPNDQTSSSPDVVPNSEGTSNGETSSAESTRSGSSDSSPSRSTRTQNDNNNETSGNNDSIQRERPSRNSSKRSSSGSRSNSSSAGNLSGGRWTSARHGYSIAPPDGFRLRRTGRRTTWRGPNGSELLVEVGKAEGDSPRQGWEQLDRALAKKYGPKYRNLGIREQIINGRDAAVWEFELDTKNGTVRKMDVAMHEGKRGYAVLGSAPVENYDAIKSQIESAVNSFRIENNDRSNSNSEKPAPSENNQNEDDVTEGY